MKALKGLMVTTRDLQYYLFNQMGVRLDTCPVSGHSAHGQVERMIRTMQERLLEAGIGKVRLYATGVQTLCKLVVGRLGHQLHPFGLQVRQGREQILSLEDN